MGDPSYLRLVPASVADTPIDWTRVPEASKKYLLERWGYDREKKAQKPLPATIADLAKMFNRSKLFGYFDTNLCTLFLDISEFGLQAMPNQWMDAGPRFYMKQLEQIFFLLFVPGKRECISGYSEVIARKEDEDKPSCRYVYEDEEEQIPAEEVVLLEKFDVRLERDISRGFACLVGASKTLGGWQASRVQDDMEASQLCEAIMTLPSSHPAKQGLFYNMFNSYKSR